MRRSAKSARVFGVIFFRFFNSWLGRTRSDLLDISSGEYLTARIFKSEEHFWRAVQLFFNCFFDCKLLIDQAIENFAANLGSHLGTHRTRSGSSRQHIVELVNRNFARIDFSSDLGGGFWLFSVFVTATGDPNAPRKELEV